MELVQVLYSSKSQNRDTSFIDEILQVSRKNNSENGLTGILLYRGGQFVQLLEGDKYNVYYTLKRIRDDRRHNEFTILRDQVVDRRLFERWAMASKIDNEQDNELNQSFNDLIQTKDIKDNLSLFNLLKTFYYN